MKYFVSLISLIILVVVIIGFFVVGSPQEQRLWKFDERRVQDLQQIQSEIINYWTSKDQLPVDLTNLRDNLRGFSTPKDPQTGEDYKYEVRGKLSFVICANFSRPELVYQENWGHKEGGVCFERTIDPEFYGKPKKPYGA